MRKIVVLCMISFNIADAVFVFGTKIRVDKTLFIIFQQVRKMEQGLK